MGLRTNQRRKFAAENPHTGTASAPMLINEVMNRAYQLCHSESDANPGFDCQPGVRRRPHLQRERPAAGATAICQARFARLQVPLPGSQMLLQIGIGMQLQEFASKTGQPVGIVDSRKGPGPADRSRSISTRIRQRD